MLFSQVQQVACSSSSRYVAINYNHFTGGVQDQAFSTYPSGSCDFTIAKTAMSAGQQSAGSFFGTLDQAPDAGSATHSITGGSYSVTM